VSTFSGSPSATPWMLMGRPPTKKRPGRAASFSPVDKLYKKPWTSGHALLRFLLFSSRQSRPQGSGQAGLIRDVLSDTGGALLRMGRFLRRRFSFAKDAGPVILASSSVLRWLQDSARYYRRNCPSVPVCAFPIFSRSLPLVPGVRSRHGSFQYIAPPAGATACPFFPVRTSPLRT